MEYPNTTDDLADLIGIDVVGGHTRETYRLAAVQGCGSQAIAFRATRAGAAGVDVVLKIFRPSFVAQHPEIAQLAFSKEWIALAQLGGKIPPCPFIVRLLDGGEVAIRMGFHSLRLPWLALDLVEGGPLGTTLRQRVKSSIELTGFALSPERALRILGCVFQGAVAIHEVGVVHRDLKPSNVLVCGEGATELAKVSDFGVARHTGMSGTFGDLAVGTPGYVAPEQLENKNVGPWSDVFSLAAVAYFALAGHAMFAGKRTVQIASAYAGKFTPFSEQENLDPAFATGDTLSELTRVIADAIHPDYRRRTPSATELWGRLEPILKGARTHVTTTAEAVSTLHMPSRSQLEWQFDVAFVPPEPLRLAAVSFDPDGHALAAGPSGLFYWEGSQWLPVAPPPGLDPSAILQMRRLGPRRWFACGEAGLVTVFTPERCEWRQRVADGRVRLTALDVVSERTFAVGGRAEGDDPSLVFCCLDGKWQRPVSVGAAAEIEAMVSMGVAAWCAAGTDPDGRGFLLGYRALRGTAERYSIASSPLHAVATDAEGTIFAVGSGGYVFRMPRGRPPALERAMTQRDLAVIATDPRGDVWAAGPGRVLRRPAREDDHTWTAVWVDANTAAPFLAIEAMIGLIIAVGVDGSVLCGRERQDQAANA